VVSRLAVVTGAGGGIGSACARALAPTHDLVLCIDRNQDSAAETARHIGVAGGRAQALTADATAADFGPSVATAARDCGLVSTVVHALAHEEHTPADNLSLDSLLTSLQVGPVSAFSLFRSIAVGGGLAPEAAFTAIGSLHEKYPFRNCLGYNAAHGALGQVVRTLAHEWSDRRVRVNAVVPGWIATPGELLLYGEEHLSRVAQQLPFRRMGSVEQVAAAVAFLSSAAADYISGSFLTVDGALSVSLAQLPGEEEK